MSSATSAWCFFGQARGLRVTADQFNKWAAYSSVDMYAVLQRSNNEVDDNAKLLKLKGLHMYVPTPYTDLYPNLNKTVGHWAYPPMRRIVENYLLIRERFNLVRYREIVLMRTDLVIVYPFAGKIIDRKDSSRRQLGVYSKDAFGGVEINTVALANSSFHEYLGILDEYFRYPYEYNQFMNPERMIKKVLMRNNFMITTIPRNAFLVSDAREEHLRKSSFGWSTRKTKHPLTGIFVMSLYKEHFFQAVRNSHAFFSACRMSCNELVQTDSNHHWSLDIKV